jgi:hypothetical protein
MPGLADRFTKAQLRDLASYVVKATTACRANCR